MAMRCYCSRETAYSVWTAFQVNTQEVFSPYEDDIKAKQNMPDFCIEYFKET